MDELINKAKNGDKEALIKVLLDMHDYLYVIARLYLKDYQYIDDVMQDTTAKALANITNLNNTDSFKYWITKILKNTCKTYNKQINFRFFNFKRYEDIFEDPNEEKHMINLNLTYFPDNNFELNRLISFLNYKERELIELRYFECMKIKDIAKELDLKVGTVKSKLSRTRNKIRKKYNKIYKNKL